MSAYCFHFIFFSDKYFRKSFQDTIFGKQSYIGNWYKNANHTILMWAIPALFWNNFTTDNVKSAHTVLTELLKPEPTLQHVFEQLFTISNPQTPYLHYRNHHMIPLRVKYDKL